MQRIVRDNSRPTLGDWRSELKVTDASPYVGPRPQTAFRDKGMLIGREKDLERITRAASTRSLVLLDGSSGVGKSSLLQNGLFPELMLSGLGVLLIRNWNETPDLSAQETIDQYLADAIARTHAELGLPFPEGNPLPAIKDGEGLFDALEDKYREASIVLILDQFEELLRQKGDIADRIVKWVIAAGYRYSTCVIISLRTDSHYLLDPLVRGVRPFSMDRVHLEEIKATADIRKVIQTYRSPDGDTVSLTGDAENDTGDGRAPIDEKAVTRLMQLWELHHPKLLDLQATLYALFFRARQRTGGLGSAPEDTVILVQDVDDLVLHAAASAASRKPFDLFTMGLQEAIRLKIQHAEDASREVRIDDYLLSGTREAVKRIAPDLSSGDFKVPVPRFQLVKDALDRELHVLGRALVEEHAAASGHSFQDAWDARDVILPEIVSNSIRTLLGPELLAETIWDGPGPERAQRRRDETAGPMMHRSATATLLEEVRRVLFAIEWLERTEIIRKDGAGILLLVHDRAGEALQAWVRAQGDNPAPKLRQLTGARGEHYVWRGKDQGIGNLDSTTPGYKVIANVSWRDCRISTLFKNVVFVNCDFSGSRFYECEFDSVTFVNCLLDDANFESCDIIGATIRDSEPAVPPKSAPGGGGVTRLGPSFTIEVSEEEIRHFQPYGHPVTAGASWLFSDTSGVPARPGPPPADHSGELLGHFNTTAAVGDASSAAERARTTVVPAPGGVAMIGGRLCFLTLYRCTAQGSSFALHHVSGGGLDIVEHNGGLIDIHDSAIRGISVTRDEDGSTEGALSHASVVDIVVNESLMVNTYFADKLAGSVEITKSVVLMLLNASDNEQFRITVTNSRYQFLVNTNVARGSEDSREENDTSRYFDLVPGSHSRFHVRNRKPLAVDLERMDYRARPDLWEERQRGRGVTSRSEAMDLLPDISHVPAGAPDAEEISACD